MDPVVLRTERLVLTVPTLDDVDAITASCQDVLLRDTLASLPWPYTRDDAASYVAEFVPAGWASGLSFTWAVRESVDGVHLGSIGWRRGAGDIGFWLDSGSRGRGYMTEAVLAVCDWVFDEQGVETIGWEAVSGNLASAGVARAAGFQYTGERPVEVVFRDGTRPMGWHGVLERDDREAPKPGWPL